MQQSMATIDLASLHLDATAHRHPLLQPPSTGAIEGTWHVLALLTTPLSNPRSATGSQHDLLRTHHASHPLLPFLQAFVSFPIQTRPCATVSITPISCPSPAHQPPRSFFDHIYLEKFEDLDQTAGMRVQGGFSKLLCLS